MKYHIEISSIAESEADSAFLRLSQLISPTKASQWYSGLLKAIESLSKMPRRCALAREDYYFSQEIRQLLSNSFCYCRGKNTNGSDSSYSSCLTANDWRRIRNF
jgi:plasmid stabilization system protein ParE